VEQALLPANRFFHNLLRKGTTLVSQNELQAKIFIRFGRFVISMALSKQPKRSVLIAARLITAVVSLAGAEAMLWFGGYPRWWAMDAPWGGPSPQYACDADLGWSAREGIFDLVWPEHPGVSHYTNWNGGRRATAEVEPARRDNRPQVMFFGDSFIQGYQLSDWETLPWIVQKRHPEVQVSNFGAGDFGTYQCYLAMKKWVHGPVSVYHLFNGFHEGRNAADPAWLRINQKLPSGCFYPYAELSGSELRDRRSEGNLIWFLSHRLRTMAMVQDYRDIFESYRRVRNKRRLTEELLAKMNETARGQGGKFTVILFDMSPEERQAYRKFLESRGIAFVDGDRPELKDKRLRLPDGHPTGALHELVAKWMEPLQVSMDRGAEAHSINERVIGESDHRFVRVTQKPAEVQ
jgi:hypothetical protein